MIAFLPGTLTGTGTAIEAEVEVEIEIEAELEVEVEVEVDVVVYVEGDVEVEMRLQVLAQGAMASIRLGPVKERAKVREGGFRAGLAGCGPEGFADVPGTRG